MGIRLVVSMQAATEKREELKTAFAELCKTVREEPGCQEYELYQSIDRPDRFVLLERWFDAGTLATHGQLLRERGLDLGALRSGPSTVERYTD